MGRFFAALAIGALAGLALSVVIGVYALIAAVVVFGVACTLLLKPSPPPSPDDAPLGGAVIASLVLGVAAAPLAQRRPLETRRKAMARQVEAIDDAVGTAVDAAGTAAELGSAYVENVIDYLTDD
jgi:hypothetical protein